MIDLYDHFQTEAEKKVIKAGWKAAGITDNLAKHSQEQRKSNQGQPV